MPFITVKMLSGRTPEQKEKLLKEITKVTAETLGIEPRHIWVVIEEVPGEQWAIGGEPLRR